MTTPRFVNFHIIHPVPFSNPNRDDTGAPKTAQFGGVTRGRMSSQSDKRASRIAFEGGSDNDRTDRTKFAAAHLADKVRDLLAAAGTEPDDDATELTTKLKTELNKLTGAKETAKDTLVWLAEREVNELAEKLAARHSEDGKLDLSKADIDSVLGESTESLTIAAFGRMFANRPKLQIEAAVQVSHAFTTHPQAVDLDYFTAVDDLQRKYDAPDAEGKVKGAGAGHLDVSQYHSGVFYRYFNVNRSDLKANWTPLSRGDDDVVDRLTGFLTAMVRDLPSGRESTAAHQTAPAHVMVTFSSRGQSFAPAFESAVETKNGSGYTKPSVTALTTYADRMLRVDGDDHRLVFDFGDEDGTSLIDLVETVATWLSGDDSALPTDSGDA